jgi:cytidylate kinase
MSHTLQNIVIAIDGFSSCGKSTVAKDLAKRLGFIYIDSGAMYRAITLFSLRNGIINEAGIQLDKLEKELTGVSITFEFNPETKRNITFLNGENVEEEIRGMAVSQNVSAISAIGFVRRHLVAQQQLMGQKGSIVMDGRDIGTVVFPNASLKVFMTASPEIRAQRRYDELTAKGEQVNFDAILDNVKQRDHLDSTRAESPLRRADDAVDLDNSFMTKDEQLDWIVNQLKIKQLVN